MISASLPTGKPGMARRSPSFVTAVDIDFEINFIPNNFVEIAVDLTYWLPEAGIDPLLGIVDEAFGSGKPLFLLNGAFPYT